MKAYINLQFGYCPLHSRTMNEKINIIHDRALRIVCQDDTSNFEKLLNMDNSVKIHTRNLQVLATVMFKLKNGIATLEVFELRIQNTI